MEVVNDAPYLRNRPESFVESADVILKLDTGETLPAHATILSFHSAAFSDMLSLNRSPDTLIQVLPFPDCTLDAALSFLQCIYAACEEQRISVQSAEIVAELSNKFGMDGILRDIDKFLADKAAPDGSSAALWGPNQERAVHWLIVACNNNLMRLAAKAERFLMQADARLSESPEAEHIPPPSLLRMLDSHRAAIEGMQLTATRCGNRLTGDLCCAIHHPVALTPRQQNALAILQALQPNYPSCSVPWE
ncbi:hypothetical protein COCOBI_16-4140 [Coccomyxa sp. Obi]|nr:hypothetical protein COCOBI_16-4140 [Coccomyxa sp. Obi]